MARSWWAEQARVSLRAASDAIHLEGEAQRLAVRIELLHSRLKAHDDDEKCPCDRCRDMRTELYGRDNHRATTEENGS